MHVNKCDILSINLYTHVYTSIKTHNYNISLMTYGEGHTKKVLVVTVA